MPTKIEYVDESWNPVTGCDPNDGGQSEACVNCYARRMARRLAGRCGYPEAPHHFDVTLHPERLEEPLRWRKPRRVFVCSMGDLFHQEVKDGWLESVWQVMYDARQHTFLILTKRPERMLDWISRSAFLSNEPLTNVWLGVTAENQQRADERIPLLLQIPAAARFVSCEPLLGPIDASPWMQVDANEEGLWHGLQTGHFVHCQGHRAECFDCRKVWVTRDEGLAWVIAGAETGPRARPADPDWFRSIRAQCEAAGVPFFFKRGSDGSRLLDGREHREWPQVAR